MSRRLRTDIQGLRAIAVLVVLLDHSSVPFLGGGYVGVDVFFVISGFLITSQLLGRLAERGEIDFADFFARRARRLLPAAIVVIVASMVGAVIWLPPLLLPQTFADAIASALYVPNYAFAAQDTDYLTVATPSLFQHFWSLGVEEQFYLLWPALLGGLWMVGSRGSKPERRRILLPTVLTVVIVGSLIAAVVMTWRDQPWAFFPLWTRAWELGAGALLAVALARSRRRLTPRVAAVAGWIGLTAIVAAAVGFSASTRYPGIAAALPVGAAALVILAGSGPAPTRAGVGLLLDRRPLQFLGRISYSLYLVHWPVLILGDAAAGSYADLPVVATLGLGALALPLAWLLHRFIEEPARRASWWVPARPRRTLAVVGTASVGVAALAAGAMVLSTVVPLDAGRVLASSAPTAPPRDAEVVPSNLQPSLRTAIDDNPSLYAEGCQVGYTPATPKPCFFGDSGGRRIVLFGDSHAAQWFPALQKIATSGGDQLETQTKSACPSVDVELRWGGKPYVRCDRWRDAVIARLKADPPDLVVLANYSRAEYLDSQDSSGQWERGLESTIEQLTPVTRVVVIAATPDLGHNPANCLSQHLGSASACALPTAQALDQPTRQAEQRATAQTGSSLIDLSDYLCAEVCPAIIGTTLVYRDSHHLTATFSRELADALGAKILPLLGA